MGNITVRLELQDKNLFRNSRVDFINMYDINGNKYELVEGQTYSVGSERIDIRVGLKDPYCSHITIKYLDVNGNVLDQNVDEWGDYAHLYMHNVTNLHTVLVSFDDKGAPNQRPTNVQTVLQSNNTIKTTWSDLVSNESGFIIQRCYVERNNPFVWETVATVGANVRTYVDNTIHPSGQWVYYQVATYNNVATTPFEWSDYIIIYPSIEEIPDPPQSVDATPYNNNFTVSWLDVSDNEEGFIVERSKRFEKNWYSVGNVSANTQSIFDNTNYLLGEEVQYRVKAYNSQGESGYRYSDFHKVGSPRPDAPSNVGVLFTTGGTPTVTWRDNSTNEDRFILQVRVNYGSWNTLNSNIAANTTMYTDNSLYQSGDRIRYCLSAFNRSGQSDFAYSNTVTVPSFGGGMLLK